MDVDPAPFYYSVRSDPPADTRRSRQRVTGGYSEARLRRHYIRRTGLGHFRQYSCATQFVGRPWCIESEGTLHLRLREDCEIELQTSAVFTNPPAARRPD